MYCTKSALLGFPSSTGGVGGTTTPCTATCCCVLHHRPLETFDFLGSIKIALVVAAWGCSESRVDAIHSLDSDRP